MKKFIILLIAGLILSSTLALSSTGCSRGYNSSKTSASINRTFEDLTLGMTEEAFRSKLIYFGPAQHSGKPIKEYMVYNLRYNIGLENTPKMKEVENVFSAYAYFFENKLFKFLIEYRNKYQPSWDSFIYNAKQKYGKGKESLDRIEWNDGQTTLVITKERGDQPSSPSLGISDYGEHYIVIYIDNELSSGMEKEEKEEAPKL